MQPALPRHILSPADVRRDEAIRNESDGGDVWEWTDYAVSHIAGGAGDRAGYFGRSDQFIRQTMARSPGYLRFDDGFGPGQRFFRRRRDRRRTASPAPSHQRRDQ